MTLISVRLLGGFACRSATGDAIAFPTRKVRALFAYLAAEGGQAQGREKLAGLLWDDRAEAQARADLRKSLSRLRQALPEAARDGLVTDGAQVALRQDLIEVDLSLFERCAADGTPETLERAAALHRGPFLEGLADCGAEFDGWLLTERRRVDEILQQVLQRLLDHYVVTGAIDRAIQVALRLLAQDPLQESVHRALIRLYMYQDRVGSALDQYRRCRELLAEELGIEPAPDTERLRAELLKLVPEDGEGGPDPESDGVPERPAVLSAAAADRARRRAELTARPSIVVLSFASDADEQRHLSDGMAEDIATELGRFRELDVIAPTTALAYRDAAVPLTRVGRELGTAYVLEGHLRLLDEELRITVRLVETATARQLWAERYQSRGAEIFDVQDDVVRRIVSTLVGQIEEVRLDAAKRRRPDDLAAYDLWLRGWSALKRPELAAIGEARRFFQQAIALDRHFARAYVGLAMAHLNEWACFTWNHWVFPRQEVLDLARKAVELDDRDQRAHCILGMTQLYAGDYEAARRQLLRALELNPNDADVLAHVAVGMALIGEHGLAVEAGRSALRLAPHHPEWYATFAGEALFAARLHEEAIATMAPAPEALCNTPAFMAACQAHLGNVAACAGHRETVSRHHRRQLARGMFPGDMSCIDWLLAMDPFQRPADLEHYREGLRKAGFA
ncbi:MAG: transcriptional regulator, family [Geminicoccaceae bacterium]|nr:transcriptional regulator, family [Geminicoccaceae bacterium]